MAHKAAEADPKAIFSQRLAQARKMRGLSLRELANLLGARVSYNALHRYELGDMLPSSNVLVALCETLKEPADFFFRPIQVSLTGIEFRKKTGLGAKKEASIKEKAADFFERYLEIEEILGLAGEFKNPLAGQNRITDSLSIENAAASLRGAWGLGMDALPSVIPLLEERHVKIYEVEGDKKFDGLSGKAGNIPAIVLNMEQPSDRKRFTALHELGHLILDFSAAQYDPKGKEKACLDFAGAMLLPKQVLFQELGEKRTRVRLDELKEIKKRFGISCVAIMKRAEKLGIFGAPQMQRFWILWNKCGFRTEDPGEWCMPEQAERFEQLVLRAATEKLISETKGAALMNTPLTEFRSHLRALP